MSSRRHGFHSQISLNLIDISLTLLSSFREERYQLHFGKEWLPTPALDVSAESHRFSNEHFQSVYEIVSIINCYCFYNEVYFTFVLILYDCLIDYLVALNALPSPFINEV